MGRAKGKGFLEPFPFRFAMELFEGFCYSSHFQERKPQPFFHAPSRWRESERQPHLHFLWSNRSRARVTA